MTDSCPVQSALPAGPREVAELNAGVLAQQLRDAFDAAIAAGGTASDALDVVTDLAGLALAATVERMIEVHQLAVPPVMVVQIAASDVLLRAQQRITTV